MTDPHNHGKDWFAPKRYGYGAGLPLTWQGWVVMVGVVVAFVVIATALSGGSRLAALAALTVVIVAVTAGRTRGGWRWRWGGKDRA